MHISDGILSSEVVIATSLIGVALTAYSLNNLKNRNIALISAMSAIFFIASFIHIPLGPTSIHLILTGVIGIIIGPLAFLSILIALLFQAILLGYGGLTSLGANLIIMALPSYLTYVLVKRGYLNFLNDKFKYFVIGFVPVLVSTLLLALVLAISKEEYIYASYTLFLANVPSYVYRRASYNFLNKLPKKINSKSIR